jgi:hypothetical protein
VDDLILVLVGAFVFAVVAAIAMMVAAAVLAATMFGTTIWAFGEGFAAFGKDFKTSVLERGGTRRAPKGPEPAFELYILGQVFADFRHALERAAEVLGAVRRRLGAFAGKYRSGPTMPVSIGAVVGGYVGTGIAAMLGVMAGILIGVTVAISAAASWALIWLLRTADAIRRRVRRASYECPTDHERFALPVYICPACGAEHKRLVPGRWGILKRECKCGKTALPTTVIRGRQRIPQRCPSGHSMSGFLGYTENLPIAIVGGPSAGKSTFLAGALIELEDGEKGVHLQPLDESREAYSRLTDAMKAGVPPEKTVDEQRPALVAEVQGSGRSRALYAYDLAGEVYSAEDKVRGLRFLARSAGIVMLVDPFSLKNVADDRAQELASQRSRVLPSSEDPMRVYERLLGTLKEAGANTESLPIAIVIAKCDAFGLDQEIKAQLEGATPGQAERAWLEANGAGNLVRSIELDFKQIGWFAVSALGRMPDPSNRRPFVPRGALAPLLWILARRDIRPSSDGTAASHTAQRLVATAADFPAPSRASRTRNATFATVASTALVLLPGIVLGVQGGRSSQASARSASVKGGSGESGTSGSGESGASGSGESGASGSGGSNTGGDTSGNGNGAKSHTPAHGGRSRAESASVSTLRRHFERLDHGDYVGAFSLMSRAYKSENPNWVKTREDADPMINIVHIGTPQTNGHFVHVYVSFYARDRYSTKGSDTNCRRFAGVAQLRREGGKWRYDPRGDSYSATVEPSDDSNCRP